MESTVLIPLDGSAYAEQALSTAAKLALALDAKLCLIHVHAPSALDPIYIEGVPVIDKDLNARIYEHEHIYLERLAGGLAGKQPALRSELAVLEPASRGGRDLTIAATLAAFAEKAAGECIVMTTHGRGGLSRFWLGSVASALIQLAHTPLLLMHPQIDQPSRGPLALRRILLPLDGSPLSEAIIEPALKLSRADNASFVLLRVVEPLVLFGPAPFTAPTDLAPERTEERVAEARAYLDEVAERLRQAGAQAETQVVVAERPAAAILEAAERSVADLIALATHGRGGLSRLLAGSVADKILRGSPLPMLVCRPRPAEER